jgi:hypothetical protein
VEEEDNCDGQTPEMGRSYYYTPGDAAAAPATVGRWIFFNPFYGTEEVEATISDKEMRAVREREGIPDLEEKDDEGRSRRPRRWKKP